jgi:hypothetical protein
MSKLRLVMFEACNRDCAGCCNNDWDLNGLDVCDGFEGYDMIMLTGGEPMLKPMMIMQICNEIRESGSAADIILYTAKSRRTLDLIAMLLWVDGITLTLHEQYDVDAFIQLQRGMSGLDVSKYQLRLNVFSNVYIEGVDTTGWKVKDGIEWIKDCPLPEGEVIQRLWRHSL